MIKKITLYSKCTAPPENAPPRSVASRETEILKRCLLLVAGGATVLVLAGCGDAGAPPVPDMGPLGDGLKVIGYAVIAAAVIVTLGKLLP